MKLIITEKPSVAATMAKFVKANKRHDGYFEGNGYLVSWCLGHLLSLANPGEYDKRYERWNMEDLPIVPRDFGGWKYVVNEDTKAQLANVKALMKRDDVVEIINACDAGREGELIFRVVYNHAKSKKPMKRLWVSSMEEASIRDAFANLKDGTTYDGLYSAAATRQRADWLAGMNLSRLYSIGYRANLSIGRVQTPTLAMIVARDEAIKNFVPQPFYIPQIAGIGLLAKGVRMDDLAKATAIVDKCQGKDAIIANVETKEKTASAPKLYDLTTLQREANKLFGYTAADTLKFAQSLYEKRLITYPRTDSRFITSEMAETLLPIVKALGHDAEKLNLNPSQVADNKKVTDHHAIVPTMSSARPNLNISQDEANILYMVSTRLVTALMPKYRYGETVVTVECEGEVFTAKGKATIDEGWKALQSKTEKEVEAKDAAEEEEDDGKLPPLSELVKGKVFAAEASLKEGKTTSPKHHTEDTLLSAMENAGNEHIPKELLAEMEKKGIGTPATRANIIEELIKKGYAQREKKNIIALEKGIVLIGIIPDSQPLKSARLTADWEQHLMDIQRGQASSADFMANLESFVIETINNFKLNKPTSTPKAFAKPADPSKAPAERELLGKCPRCGGNIYESPKAYSCENSWNKDDDKRCRFIMWKDNRFFENHKKALTKTAVKAFLKKGETPIKGLVHPKTGEKFEAVVQMADDGRYVNFRVQYGGKA